MGNINKQLPSNDMSNMLDALKTLKDDELIILMNGDSKPIILKNAKDDSLIQLILPIKTY